MTEFEKTEHLETEPDLMRIIVWDDDEDPVKALASGRYPTVAGEWRRDPSGAWRFWKDKSFVVP